MIVVASHNNIELLNNLLNTLSNIDLCNHKVLIIDTNSDSQEYKNYFTELKYKFPNFMFENVNYICWDSGAYIYAYLKYPNEENYIFLQDSISITNSNLIYDWTKLLKNYNVVPWSNFRYWYENDEQQKWSEDGLPLIDNPLDSIFGPIFGVSNETMNKLPKEWLKHPTNKNEGCGMERRWSAMFHCIGATKYYIEYSDDGMIMHHSKININKHFYNRL